MTFIQLPTLRRGLVVHFTAHSFRVELQGSASFPNRNKEKFSPPLHQTKWSAEVGVSCGPHLMTTATKSRVDDFYPVSDTVRNAATGKTIAVIGYDHRLRRHLAGAKAGDRDRESRLVNRLGQLRRSLPKLSEATPDIRLLVKECVEYLRSVGRTVDFANTEPALWISQRGGNPRW